MAKKLMVLLVFCTILGSGTLSHVSAYTYGDPNEEAVAEAYKSMLVELNEEPADYQNAIKYYKTVQEEVDMHMGPDVSPVILKHLEDEDKEEAIRSMEQLLVLNIARRLDSIEKNFEQYDTSKKLLAKAFATYEALSPKVEPKDPELDQKMKTEFDNALNALGNPGLFGVGKKEANLDQFLASKEKILASLQKEFELKSLDVGHFSESATEKADVKNNDWTDITKVSNWLPLLVLIGIFAAVIVYVRKKRK